MVTITKYVWDPVFDCVSHELDETNAVKALYQNEPQQYGGVLSQRRGTTSHYHHHDALGSTRFLTDSSGTVTDTYLHDAWGNSVASTGTTVNPFKWLGKFGYYTDNSTAQVYVRARMYQPTAGRWGSVDPLLFVDGKNLYTAYFVPNSTDPGGTLVWIPPAVIALWLVSKCLCVNRLNEAASELGHGRLGGKSLQCYEKASAVLRRMSMTGFECLVTNLFERSIGGRAAMTSYHFSCPCSIWLPADDLDCETCDGLALAMATIVHECDHCLGSKHPDTYCNEAVFLNKLIHSKKLEATGPCKTSRELQLALIKQRDIAETACKEGGY